MQTFSNVTQLSNKLITHEASIHPSPKEAASPFNYTILPIVAEIYRVVSYIPSLPS